MKFAVNRIINGEMMPIVLTDEEVKTLVDMAMNVSPASREKGNGRAYSAKTKEEIKEFIKVNDAWFGGKVSVQAGADKFGISTKTYRKLRDEVSLMKTPEPRLSYRSPLSPAKRTEVKKLLMRHDPTFGGNMLVKDVVKMAGVSKPTYYRLRNEIVKAVAA